MELELGLDPDDAARLTRLRTPRAAEERQGTQPGGADRLARQPGSGAGATGPGAGRAAAAVAAGAAAPRDAELAARRARPGAGDRLATAAALGQTLPDPLVPLAAFEGRAVSQSLATEQGPVGMTLLNGAVRAFTGEHRISRVRLEGAAEAVQALAIALAGELRLAVPRASLAAEAFALASGMAPPPRREGAPELPAGLSVAEAFAHAVGHLSDVILYFAPKAAGGKDGPEPVHQMRVAVRRLRSAIKVFRHAVRHPAVDAADAGLKALAAKLAPTRDWDVFVTETAAGVAAAFPAEPRLQRLLAAAERRRRACHDELRGFLTSAEFRRLGIELACLAGGQDGPAMVGDGEQDELTALARGIRRPGAAQAAQEAHRGRRRPGRPGAAGAARDPPARQAAALRGGDLRAAVSRQGRRIASSAD